MSSLLEVLTPVREAIVTRAISFNSRPRHLIWGDICLVCTNFWSFFYILSPTGSCNGLSELYLWDYRNLMALIEQIIWFIASPFILIFLLVLPLLISTAIVGLYMLLSSLRDPIIDPWQQGVFNTVNIDDVENEKWFFVNGVCVGRHWQRLNIYRLSHFFGRRIIGVHNRTLGIWFDLIQSILQRDFGYATRDVTTLFKLASNELMKESVTRVVLIGHSQGGIIVSLALDRLLADLPAENLAKLEIYTFASASNHFCSPLDQNGNPLINKMEHFANSHDFVSRIGVLNFHMSNGSPNHFFGKLFKHLEQRGHLLNQHYLNAWFAKSDTAPPSQLRDSELFRLRAINAATPPNQMP